MTEVSNLVELNKRISKFLAKVENRKPLLRRVGLFTVRYIRKTLAVGGRTGRPWEDLSPFTIALRRNKNKSKIKPLIDKGILRNSIHILTMHLNAVDVGTVVNYAPVLHFGGMSKRKEFNFKIRAHKRKGRPVKAHGRHLILSPKRIPARPYMYVGTGGEANINKMINRYIDEALNEAA